MATAGGATVGRPGAPAASARDTTELLTSFFVRLGELEAIVAIVLREAPLSATLTFRNRGSEQTVLLDFTARPGRIAVGPPRAPGRIQVKVDSDVMHQVLTGRLSAGEALGRRALLLRGAPSDLACFIPLFDFAPLLYREHLADEGVEGFARPAGALIRREVDMEMTSGRATGPARPWRGPPARALSQWVGQAAYAAGYGVGLLRHRYLRSLSLFDVMAAMARGLTAASERVRRTAPSGRGEEDHGPS